jgi:serine protease
MKRQTVLSMGSWTAAVAAAGLFSAACGMDDVEITGEEQAEAKFVRAGEPVSDSYIVVLKSDDTARARVDVPAAAAALGDTYGSLVHETFDAVRMFTIEASEEAALALADDPRVALVQENGMKYAIGTQNGATWGLDRIDQRDRPLNQTYTWDSDGTGVTAYVVDTGVRVTHTNLGNRASHGFSAIDDGNGSSDCHGHGTHVAGTVGSTTYGVAKNVQIKAVRVLNCQGSGTDAEVIAGINYVKDSHSGPSVANMSLGGDAAPALDLAVQQAIAAGVSFVVAAGNESRDACLVSPARAPEAVTVGATTNSDGRAFYSNFGTCLDIFAPGDNITSLWGTGDSATSTISGTSMASPHVAGAAALILAANPAFTPAQVREALVANASSGKVGNPGNGSPNKLLFTGSGTPPGPGPRNDTFSGIAAFFGFSAQSTLTVVPGTRVKVTLQNTFNNADLYVRFGAAPTATAYDCRPALSGAETCDLTVPAGVTQVFVSVRDASFLSAFSGTREWVGP